MHDVEIVLDDRPGALADMGEALGRAGISVEGGGGWVIDGRAVMHFLFEDGPAARAALQGAGIATGKMRSVVSVRLRQDQPGQLGAVGRRMAEAGVNIDAVYSDHDHRLVLVVDDTARASAVAGAWVTVPAGETVR